MELKNSEFKKFFGLESGSILTNSVLKTSNPIDFNTERNKILGFINILNSEITHKSQKPVMITSVDKVHQTCDCNGGSDVDGIRRTNSIQFQPYRSSRLSNYKNVIHCFIQKD